MRILYSFPRIVGRPGVGTTAFHQITGLIREGHELVVYAKECEAPLPGAVDVLRTVPARRASPTRLLAKGSEGEWHDWRVAAAVRRLKPSLDAIYTWPGASRRTLLAAQRAGLKTFLEIPHAHVDYQYSNLLRNARDLGIPIDETRRQGLSDDNRRRYKAEYRLAEYLMVPSDFVRTMFIDAGHPSEKLALHRYGFDPERFPEPDQAHRSGNPTVLYLGRCEPLKGLDVALRAWREIGGGERATFIIAGRFDREYREYLSDELADTSVQVVTWTDDPGALMRSADVFVAPSLEEGSALVCYEAQASGCAVLASDACGARLGPLAQSLVHPAGNWRALASSLRSLLEDRSRIEEMRAEALARRQCLTWEAATRQLSDTLMTLL